MTIKLAVLLSGIPVFGNENATFFPLKVHAKQLKQEYGLEIEFFRDHRKCKEADHLLISSWYFGRKLQLWKSDKDLLFSELEKLNQKFEKTIWFDISDSTGTTQFEVLPHIGAYWKSQLLRQLSGYERPTNSGRVFTDFYINKWGGSADEVIEPHLVNGYEERFSDKIKLAWNTGLGHFGMFSPYFERFDRVMPGDWTLLNYPGAAASPSLNRSRYLSCRFGTKYQRKSVSLGRSKTAEILQNYIATNKLNRKLYFEEMKNSKLVISPFGLGEITLRDFEVFLCGAALIKPKMDHMDTWPNFYDPSLIFEYSWDLSDLDAIIDDLRHKDTEILEKATASQRNYLKFTSGELSGEYFCEHLMSLLTNKA